MDQGGYTVIVLLNTVAVFVPSVKPLVKDGGRYGKVPYMRSTIFNDRPYHAAVIRFKFYFVN